MKQRYFGNRWILMSCGQVNLPCVYLAVTANRWFSKARRFWQCRHRPTTGASHPHVNYVPYSTYLYTSDAPRSSISHNIRWRHSGSCPQYRSAETEFVRCKLKWMVNNLARNTVSYVLLKIIWLGVKFWCYPHRPFQIIILCHRTATCNL